MLKINRKEKDHLEDLGINARTFRKSTFKWKKEMGSGA
jgi:hypothetical protein